MASVSKLPDCLTSALQDCGALVGLRRLSRTQTASDAAKVVYSLEAGNDPPPLAAIPDLSSVRDGKICEPGARSKAVAFSATKALGTACQGEVA